MVKRAGVFIIGLVGGYLLVILVLANIQGPHYTLFQYLTRTEIQRGWFGYSLQRFWEAERFREVDILFVGSSYCYRAFDPRVFTRAGLTSFDIGSDAQTPLNSHYLLRRYSKQLSPRLVVFEVNPIIFSLDGLESYYDILYNTTVTKDVIEMGLAVRSPHVINALTAKALSFTGGSRTEMRQTSIPDEKYVAGGHVAFTGAYRNDKIGDPYEIEVLDFQFDYLEQNIEYAKSRGAAVLLVIAPSLPRRLDAITNYEQLMERIQEVAQRTSVPFHDFNREMILSEYRHFRDSRHLNSQGAELFSKAVLNLMANTPIIANCLDLDRAGTTMTDKNDQEIADASRALLVDSTDIDAFLQRSTAYRKKGLQLLALDDLERILRINPRHVQAIFDRGCIRYQMGQLDAAIADFTTVVTLDPNHSGAFNNRGAAFAAKEDTLRALSDLSTALSLDSTMPAALLTRGLWYRDCGQVEKAVADLQAFLRHAGDEWAGYRNRVNGWIIELQER